MEWTAPKSRDLCVFLLLLIALPISSGLLISCGGANSQPLAPTTGVPQTPSGPAANPTPGSAAKEYLYIGIASDQGGIQGFHMDTQTGALAEVPGSPLLFGQAMNTFSQAGAVAAAGGHVYVGFGPPNFQSPVIRSYTVDASTGSLGDFVETNAGAVAGDEQIRGLVTDPMARNLYAVYQNNIASFQINEDGSLTFLGTASNLATAFIFALTIDLIGNRAFLGVDNCPPKGTSCIGPPDIMLLDRDPNTGMLANAHQLEQQNSIRSPGALAVDPSGNHLAAWTVDASGNSQISVFNIDAKGALTPAAGSPHSTPGGLPPVAFGFDSSGHFLYVLNSSDASPQPEGVTVYAFETQSGTLQQLQNEPLPSGNFPAALLVEDSLLVVVNSQAGSMPSVIYVLQRDQNSGMVSSPVFTQTDRPGGLQAGLGEAVVLRF